MQVFKVYFKILRKLLPSICVYTAIFLVIVSYSTIHSRNQQNSIYNEQKVKTVFINEDQSSDLIKGYQEYLSNYCEFVTMKTDTTSLKDALFFRKAVYVIKIPKGFTKDFLNQTHTFQIEKITVPDSAKSVSVDMATNRYFKTASLYQKYMKHISQEKLVDLVKKNLDLKAKVSLDQESAKGDLDFMVSYNNYMSYALISILVLSVGMVMLSFHKLDLKRRTLIAPVSSVKLNLELILGNFVLTMACLIVLFGAEIFINPQFTWDKGELYLLINAVFFSIAILAISFLVGIAVKSEGTGKVLVQILSLGMCFISGVFVPQELLNGTLLKIAAFTPCYWFVKANNLIGTTTDFSLGNMRVVHQYMLIEVGFAVALFAVALVTGKLKNQEV
jgi:ABC-type multidrug transport system, permease component